MFRFLRDCFRPCTPVRSRHRRRLRPQLEELETRLTPATLVDPFTVTYQDVDGDKVTVLLSKPLFVDEAAASAALDFDTGSVNGNNTVKQQLQSVFLDELANADGVGVKITAVRSKVTGGDGLVNVGEINGTSSTTASQDVGKVVVDGDLGRIVAEDGRVAALTVQSLGRLGISTGAADLVSAINTGLGALKVKSDVKDAFVDVRNGSIGSIFVGGSLLGGTAANSGSIRTKNSGNIGSVVILGDMIGGTGADSGSISSASTFEGGLVEGVFVGVRVGGSVLGGAGERSGSLYSTFFFPAIKIGGDLRGGAGTDSGRIDSQSISKLSIGGSLIGGSQSGSGSVDTKGLGPVKVGRDIQGGSGSQSGALLGGDIASVFVGGSIRGGSNALSAFIGAGGVLGPVTVNGNLVGTAANPVRISGGGDFDSVATDLSVVSVKVRGRVEFAHILAGVRGDDATPFNADAQIGKIVVGGDWITSSAAAGAVDGGNGFGNSLDAKISETGGEEPIVSRIGSIVIKGQVLGTAAFGDHFGFVAEEIGSFSVAGTLIPLIAGLSNDGIVVGVTSDVRINEI